MAFTANAIAGAYTVNALATGLATPAVFSLTNATGISLPANVIVPLTGSVSFPVTLSAPAPPSGLFVSLATSNSTTVTVTPTEILIPGGATAPSVQPKVNGVSYGSAVITASATGYAPVSQTVLAADTIVFSPNTLTANPTGTQQLFLLLTAPAPAGGLTVNVSSSNPGVATVPATVTFRANTTNVNVPLTPVGPGSTTITASAPTVPATTAAVTVN
jgi:hypothetical protein